MLMIWRPVTLIGGKPALGLCVELTLRQRMRFKWLVSAELWPKRKQRDGE